jgi:hypothetical protein
MGRFLKQPLLHFLLVGALLFIVYGRESKSAATSSSPSATDPIVVDRAGLLDYMQYQSKAFDAALFSQRLDAMPDGERQALIKDYVRE